MKSFPFMIVCGRVRLFATTIAVLFAATVLPDACAASDVGGWRPYCGLYCVYGALRYYGRPAPFDALVASKYISDETGSSLIDLTRAIGDFGGGLQATPFEHYPVDSINSLSPPVILHVRATGGSIRDDHFILYLGRDDEGRCIVMDNTLERHCTIGELASRWNGTGILVTDGAAPSLFTVSPSLVLSLTLVAGAIAVIWFVDRRRIKRREAGIFPIVATVAVASVAYGRLAPVGLWHDGAGVSVIQAEKADTWVSRADAREVEEAVGSGRPGGTPTLLVDARLRSDFLTGTIGAARGIMPSADDETIRDAMSGVATTRRIVVFCSNASCDFSSRIAGRLFGLGWTNVAVFKPGYDGWKRTH